MDYTKRSQHQKLVDELMEKAGQELPIEPTIPGPEVRLLRSKLNGEEYLESNEGLGVQLMLVVSMADIEEFRQYTEHGAAKDLALVPITKENLEYHLKGEPNLREIVDGGGDMLVTVTGMLSACGINDHSVLMSIDENNLKKFGPGGYRRVDGKWMKPSDHVPPDIEGIIEKQRQRIIENVADMESEEKLGYIIAEFIQNKQTPLEIRTVLINILKTAGLQT